MKDRRAGAGFPFSIGCMSQSAVAVADPLEKKPMPPPPAQQLADTPSSSTTAATTQERGAGEESGEDKARNAAASGIVSAGVQRLLKGIKTFFAAYDGEEEEDEDEAEIVIGFPTDVQHVGHIGWDGINKVGGMVGAFSLPSSLSLRQLEIAMDPGASTTTCFGQPCNMLQENHEGVQTAAVSSEPFRRGPKGHTGTVAYWLIHLFS